MRKICSDNRDHFKPHSEAVNPQQSDIWWGSSPTSCADTVAAHSLMIPLGMKMLDIIV